MEDLVKGVEGAHSSVPPAVAEIDRSHPAAGETKRKDGSESPVVKLGSDGGTHTDVVKFQGTGPRDPDVVKMKLKCASEGKSKGLSKKLAHSNIVIKAKKVEKDKKVNEIVMEEENEEDVTEDEDDEVDEEEDLNTDEAQKNKFKGKRKLIKKGKKERIQNKGPEMKELIVGRRMASLNASAMMQVLYNTIRKLNSI